MKWSKSEIIQLSPVLEGVRTALEPQEGQDILVLCSAGGEMAFRLADQLKTGHIVGAELDPALVEASRASAEQRGLAARVDFCPTEKNRLSFHDNTFDGLVSEFIVFPSPTPTEIGQPEMARVLRPGGRMVITDVIVPQPVSMDIREELRKIGLDYLCEGTAADFRSWMEAAGLMDIEVKDLTPVIKSVWEQRAKADPSPDHRKGYALLLEESTVMLGKGLFYICVSGTKPDG